MKRRKVWVWALFFFGLLFEFSAFLTSHVNAVPFARRIVLLKLAVLEDGMITLDQSRELKQGERGFAEMERLVLGDLTSGRTAIRQRAYEDVGDLHSGIEMFKHRISKDSERFNSPESIQIRAFLKDGGRTVINRDALKSRIKELISLRVIFVSAAIFVFGILLQLWGFVIGERGRIG